ncbi:MULTISPECIES: F0F1 ATP synthase subunit delta [unclassified Neisseria]|uniref:F0F1 ATP synthase subunit delta n=1 Tax=unclassified Neisseria TaxID=2623750 RepID=UPI002665C99E|nr:MULTISPECIES: F0F1 ATP synthase subunit delta [unclassified Neisseria]MDO1510837.1 F0F1 ATP synthase subunit delta [Neisseria sp. MVDL19-042950]MDO1517162.1 F0F1 ATP synthase subunit delta [Neisseria sp. MVDL18-041461]MDO1564525.1 F0F1 ATP synthase subunit delta [Neisseria sp. MVDL20-010259]
MAEFATIARPYAKALFGLAQEKNQIESWLGGLKELSSVVQQVKIAAFIEQPEKSASDKAEVLVGLVELNDASLKNFVHVLAEQKRLQLLPEVYAQFQDLSLTLNHTKRAVIYSAYELTDVQLKDLVAELQERFGTSLEITTEVDSELIGGVKVEMGDQVLDLSLQGKLNALYAAMIN